MSRCLSCNRILSSRESTRKYRNYEQIANPEHRYIGLCNSCYRDVEIDSVENTSLPDNDAEDELDWTSVDDVQDDELSVYKLTEEDRLG